MRSGLILFTLCAFLAAAQNKDGPGDPAKGKQVFARCVLCHLADSDRKKAGPGMKGLFKRAKLKNGKPLGDRTVRAVIDAGGGGMPPYRTTLSAQDKDHLIAYLKTL